MSKKLKFELNENNIKLFIKLNQETKQNEDQIIRSYIDYLNKNINTISNMNFDSDKETLKFINKFKIDNMKYFKYDLDKCVEELQKNNILLNKKQVLKIFNFIDNI
jgi:hypothetical protein